MVSIRCKMIVKEELNRLGIEYSILELGMVELKEALNKETIQLFNEALQKYGLEILENKKAILVEKITTLIIEMVHYSDKLPELKYSALISEKLGYNYTYLANLFSEVKGTTIENFRYCPKKCVKFKLTDFCVEPKKHRKNELYTRTNVRNI